MKKMESFESWEDAEAAWCEKERQGVKTSLGFDIKTQKWVMFKCER